VLKKINFLIFTLAIGFISFSQESSLGIITGNVLDDKGKAVLSATVELIKLEDSLQRQTILTDKDGEFAISNISFGYYRLRINYVGMQLLNIDSIHFRTERFDFNLSDLTLKPKSTQNLGEVIIYAEKPLIESKEGNITFNVGESALAAGSNASDLLTNVPLVTKDADGKITVRGKEPKILIDDKPVELNLQQLQDLLESMPGSSIDKIEVMTNPPPQYANEEGGVINIITKKGKVGKSGRVSLTAGTRGEASMNGSFTYRKQNFSININIRPNFRMNVNYDLNKNNSLNLVFNYNQNTFDNTNNTEYQNINRFDELWKLSQRQVTSEGDNYSPNLSFSYAWKGKPGETLKVITSYNFSSNNSDRLFYQEYFNPDYTPNGIDSTQRQVNSTEINNYNVRVNYDRLLAKTKTFLSVGGYYNRSNNHVIVDASYKKKPEGSMERLELLSNDFWFHQTITNFRGSIKQLLGTAFSFTAGTSLERTDIWFELLKESKDVKNNYFTWLPFANINKTWKEKLSLTFSYRRTINRPGITQLNPAIDYSDPYNVRFGNDKLEASSSHNFDFVAGRTKPKYFLNLGMGYNIVDDVFSQVRTLLPEGKTQITWENISGRKEYEISTWNGVTLSKKLKLNASASYTYSKYSDFDITVRRFRNGGSFTSNVTSSFSPKDIWNFTGGFNINRFGNPQGFARWNTSMNLGIQKKFFNKKLIATINIIDPFVNQQRRIFTYATNFNLESYSITQTRNFRLSLAYNLTTTPKKKPAPTTKKAVIAK